MNEPKTWACGFCYADNPISADRCATDRCRGIRLSTSWASHIEPGFPTPTPDTLDFTPAAEPLSVGETSAPTEAGPQTDAGKAATPLERQGLVRELEDVASRFGQFTIERDADVLHRAIVALSIEPDNHHSAEACPYCNPQGLKLVDPALKPLIDVALLRKLLELAFEKGRGDGMREAIPGRRPIGRDVAVDECLAALQDAAS